MSQPISSINSRMMPSGPRTLGIAVFSRRGMELDQLDPAVPVGGLKHRDVDPDAVETDDAIHPFAPDRTLALWFQSEFREECGRGRQVVHDDAHVLHPPDGHEGDGIRGGSSDQRAR